MAQPTIGKRHPIIITAPAASPASVSIRASDDSTAARVYATATTATGSISTQPLAIAAGASATYYVDGPGVFYVSALVAGVEMAGGIGSTKRIEIEGGVARVTLAAPSFPNFFRTIVVAGALTAAAGTVRYPFPIAATVLGISLNINTAPVGADLIVDINKNGTTIFTTQANRPKIVDGSEATVAEVTNMDITAYAAGDYLTVDVDQIGSGTAGSNLTVTIRYQ